MRHAPAPAALTPHAPARPNVARRAALSFALWSVSLALLFPPALAAPAPKPQGSPALTPLQRAIATEEGRLSSAEVEERRDAVARLRAMARPEASRAAAGALGDSSAVVRAEASHAVLSLGPFEAAALIVPLLKDRDEFVRREAAYALGRTRGAVATPPLVAALETDRSAAVRGAAAVALGRLADPQAIPALANSLARRLPAPGFATRGARRRAESDEFVRRSAAVALGLIGDRVAVPVLAAALADEREADDVRREAASALGKIGDPASAPALRAALNSRDPHLARIAFEALRELERRAAGPAG
jgi:HEAT repeat protein